MIFEDPSRRRWKVTLLLFGLLCIVGGVLLATFIVSIFVDPPLPSVVQREQVHSKVQQIKKTAEEADAQANQRKAQREAAARLAQLRKGRIIPTGAPFLHTPPKGDGYVTAFLQEGDPDSVASLQAHVAKLDAAFPDWYFLTQPSCNVTEKIDADTQKLLLQNHVAIFPRVSNGDAAGWHGAEMHAILANADLRACTAEVLANLAAKSGVPGLNLDIEDIRGDTDNYLEFLILLRDKLHAQHRMLTVDVTLGDPAYDIEQIGAIADGVVLMAYDEHYASADAGPVASYDWFAGQVDEMVARMGSGKLIVAMGNYGYDWTVGSAAPAQSLKFYEVMDLADAQNADVAMDTMSRNMRFAYMDARGARHDVWFLNGLTAWNEWKIARSRGVLGVGLWRLGTEDPLLWSFLGDDGYDTKGLSTAPMLRSIQYLNEGEVFHLQSFPQAGSINVELDTDGTVDYAKYETLPSGYVVDRVGAPIPAKDLVLTFDDGPDPVWTPEILKVLHDTQAPATFFMVGQQADHYPEIVERVRDAGMLAGNHSYLHPNFSTISRSRIRLELNSTQRLIEAAFGKRTVLFRPPYDTDTTPDDPAALDPLREVTQLGYIIVGANIDSQDWSKPGVNTIVSNVTQGLRNPANHIIVFHDAGGDRGQTVQALAFLIPALRAQGYRFVSLDAAIGIPATTLMPPLSFAESVLVFSVSVIDALVRWFWLIVIWLFLFTTLLAILRILFLGYLVVRSARSQPPLAHGKPPAKATVLIPAYNEEKTLARTIHALQQSSTRELEILVIDDGSTDGTAMVVRQLQKDDPRIRLVEKKNEGKAAALNRGFREAAHPIVVTIDADTLILKDTVKALLEPFADPAVDAVCGNVEVGNVHNILTGFQALEYITTQNFDRRAFDELNCISVVPGATGAWRKKRVLAIGGYTHDTLTEDADLTLTLLRDGGRIVYAPDARARTEAPETVGALAKQRFRWSYGTFQCLRKHAGAFFQGTLGWVALPNMFFFQILFPVLSPVGDLVFLLSILRGDVNAILVGYVLFLLMDVCGSLLAFSLEKRPKKLMWLILIQRFFYRQFMYVITFRAIIAMLRGRRHGWNKLERKGSVKWEEAPIAA